MARADQRHPATSPALGTMSLLAIAGATAAAWLWNRQREDALRQRTAERLRPLGRTAGT